MIVGLGKLALGETLLWQRHALPEALHPGRAFYKVGNVLHDMETSGDESLLGVAFEIRALL